MKKTFICIMLLLISVLAYSEISLRADINHEKHAGVSIETDFLEIENYKLGIGGAWLEVNEDDVNRLFPVYAIFRLYTDEKLYFFLKGGNTFGDDHFRYYEAGVGREFEKIRLEISNQHYDNENYLKFSYGILF